MLRLVVVVVVAVVVVVVVLLLRHSSRRIPVFVRLDCGGSTNYIDSSTGIRWETDLSFGLDAVSSNTTVDPPPSASLLVSNTQLSSIRYFTGNQTKYCYTVDDPTYRITSKPTYLVRATFWVGNTTNGLPSALIPNNDDGKLHFQLLLNADVWTNVSIPIPQTEVVQKEAYVVALSSSISVCLSGAGLRSVNNSLGAIFGTPFISSLEILQIPIDENRIAPLYQFMRTPSSNKTRAVYLVDRINYGSSTNMSVRYPDDVYDRIWRGNTSDSHVSTTARISGLSSNNHVPLSVMQTALAKDHSPVNDSGFDISIQIPTPIFSGSQGSYAYCLYFAEISEGVTGSSQRVFEYDVYTADLGENNGSSNGAIDLYGETGNYAVVTRIGSFQPDDDEDNVRFTFTPDKTSTYAGPLLSALELYRVSDQDASFGVHDCDARALSEIREALPSALGPWSGDACLPYPYDWVQCSSSDSDNAVHIISLSLAHKGLSGSIPDDIGDLKALQSLDLQGNNFSGPIPDFLENLPNLKNLFLKDNNFCGDIPSNLLDKRNSGALNLSVDDNRRMCGSPAISPRKLAFIVGGSITGVILLISVTTIVFCLVWKHRKQKQRVDANEDGNENATQVMANGKGPRKLVEATLHFCQCLAKVEDAKDIHLDVLQVNDTNDILLDVNQLRCFTYEDIENITNSFSRKLGRGGFGDVFHGKLSHDVEVAIKVSTKDTQQGSQAFLNEVALLSRVHHRNLVKLIGYCKETKLMLVYEYMPNGSLDDILLETRLGSLRFTWNDRLKIAIGAAEGLDYLHNGCTPPIIHRDVKSSNILLNAKMEAKISDFGISRPIIGSSTDRTLTTIVGSRGYLPPDIINANKINEKVDVYAFGVVLLELVTGQKPIFKDGDIDEHITDWVKSKIEGGELQAIVDPTIGHGYNLSSLWNVIDVALQCVLPYNHERPQMSEVSSKLKNALTIELQGNMTTEFIPNINVNLCAR